MAQGCKKIFKKISISIFFKYFSFIFVFMSFIDTESVFLDVALLLEILQGSHFHFMTI